MARILVVEDDRDLADLSRMQLEEAGFAVEVRGDGLDAWQRIEAGEHFDLVLLDLGLPGMDGLDLCRRIRTRDGYLPLIVLTARGAELDRVLGLELGADDYLVKPVGGRELIARVRALLRRAEALAAPAREVLSLGPLHLDPARRRVTVEGVPVELTAKEFDLLAHFMRAPGQVFTREELLEAVWGRAFSGYEHTVNSHMNRLRGKLGEARGWLETVWGVGYRLVEASP